MRRNEVAAYFHKRKFNTKFTEDDVSEIVLKHHGIKGQQWGVRRGPPYPIEDTVLRKGTVLSSVSGYNPSSQSLYDSMGRPKYLYNPKDEHDRKVYEGAFSMYLLKYKGANFVYKHKYEVVKDLKMPTKQQRLDEFSKLYNDKKFKKAVIADCETYKDMMVKYDVGSTPEMKKRVKDINLRELDVSNKKDLETAYEIFNHAMEAQHKNKSTAEYVKRMSSKYDAMVDDNNVGMYNNAHDPIVIFKTNEVLKMVGSEPVYSSNILKDVEALKKDLNRHGVPLKL